MASALSARYTTDRAATGAGAAASSGATLACGDTGLEAGDCCGNCPREQIGLETSRKSITSPLLGARGCSIFTFMQIQNGIEGSTGLHHLYVHIPFCPKV